MNFIQGQKYNINTFRPPSTLQFQLTIASPKHPRRSRSFSSDLQPFKKYAQETQKPVCYNHLP